MKQNKTSYREWWLPLLAGVLLLCPGITSRAQAQSGHIVNVLAPELLDDPRFQYYPFTYDSRGSSIWGPGVPGTQTLDFDLPLVSPTWTDDLGAFYNPCWLVDCTFGAGLRVNVSATAAARFHAKADLGSVDLYCPGGVGITYPKSSDIVPGKPFTIDTYLIVDRTAYMNINAAHLGLSVGGRIDASVDAALVAEAFGDDLVNINLFKLLGLDSPSFGGEAELINTGNLLPIGEDYPLPIPPNIGSGYFHVPNLAARGTLRNSGVLKARAADNFLTLTADITNLLVQYAAFGIPIPLEGDYDFGGFTLDFHLLDLVLQASAGIRQDFVFDPRPLIQFKTLGGTTKYVRAGDSVTFTAPTFGFTSITPTILYDRNAFSDTTSLTVDPSLSFDLIRIKGGGSVAGHDLFSFNLNPFGTQTLGDTFALELFQQQFALPAPASFICPSYRVFGSIAIPAGEMSDITRFITTDDSGNATVTGFLGGANLPQSFTLHIQGDKGAIDQSVNISVGNHGFFTTTIPDVARLGKYRPLTLTGEYVTPTDIPIHVPLNPVTIYWPRPPLNGQFFGGVVFDPQQAPNGTLTTFADSGKFKVALHTTDVEPDATLLYDDLPIPTTLTPSTDVPDGLLVTGEIPAVVMDRGGSHTLSFVNSGLNQTPVLLKNLIVNYAKPTVSLIYRSAPATPTAGGNLLIRGTGYTVDTAVSIDGRAHTPNVIGPTEMRVALAGRDEAPGAHRVVVGNPAPGGGNASGQYTIAPIPPDVPVMVAKHGLIRHQSPPGSTADDFVVTDLITLTNHGKNTLRDVKVTSVQFLNRGKVYLLPGLPQSLPMLHPGEYSTIQVVLPAHSSAPGDAGVLLVRGTVHGKAFALSNRVTLPGFLPMNE